MEELRSPVPAPEEGEKEIPAGDTPDEAAAHSLPVPAAEPGPAPEAEKEARADEAALRAKAHRRHMRALRDMIFRLAALLLVVYVLFFHLVGITVMPGGKSTMYGDMYPRIDVGDLVMYYRLDRDVKAQDVIVFRKPAEALEQAYREVTPVARAEKAEKAWWRRALDWLGFRDPADGPQTLFVSRVIARPGDTVEITDHDVLLVNGNAVVETGIFSNSTPMYGEFVSYPLTLGEDEYFVLADERNGGEDSRFFGPVTVDEILGTVITIVRRNRL